MMCAIDEVLWIWQKKSNNIHDLNSHIWDSWADPDGSMTLETYVLPKWVKRSSGWVPVDPSLVKGSDGAVVPAWATVWPWWIS